MTPNENEETLLLTKKSNNMANFSQTVDIETIDASSMGILAGVSEKPKPEITYEHLKLTIFVATAHARNIAQDDGHWVGELCANPTITAEYVFLHQALQTKTIEHSKNIVRWLLSEQQTDGSWTIAWGHPGDVSTTVEVYLALKILGLPTTDKAMLAAKNYVLRSGGIEKIRIFTRFYLACFGLWSWKAVPEMPAELILLPSWSPINIYYFSSWARSTIVPLLVVCHHRPIFALPNGLSDRNNYLDELWITAQEKNVPYGKPISTASVGWLQWLFLLIDVVLGWLDGLRWCYLSRAYAIRKCISWVLEHQEAEGDWAGIFPPMHFGVLALALEGFELDDPKIARALAAIDRFAWSDVSGKRFQSCVSPVWDTVLMTIALCDAEVPAGELIKATQWVKTRQLSGHEGDWRIYCKGELPGGFSFEYFNRWYPDVDDTAAAVIAFLKQDSSSAASTSVQDAVTWMISMQNRDGGWAAFDKDNDKLWLNEIPFSDMNSLCDPSTADVTARILEALGVLMESGTMRHAYQWSDMLTPIKTSIEAAIRFLADEQEACGAWYGRWGVNYIYGTSNVLCGLEYWKTDPLVQHLIPPAVAWLLLVQNYDGGWGEGLESYRDPKQAGCGNSTASQTAWAVMGLLAHLPSQHDAIRSGVSWLIAHFDEDSGTWPEMEYTGTGFPNHFYIRYSLYSHYFPLMALGRYARALREQESSTDTKELLRFR